VLGQGNVNFRERHFFHELRRISGKGRAGAATLRPSLSGFLLCAQICDALGSLLLRNRENLAAAREFPLIIHKADVVVTGAASGQVPEVAVQD
jgi:hypothetical protein